LGFGADMRDYALLLPMFQHLNITAVRLMTNNPRKVAALQEIGVQVAERIALQTDANPHNEKYLKTKAGKLGHMFEID
jgi:GTP cyclohydrolase II